MPEINDPILALWSIEQESLEARLRQVRRERAGLDECEARLMQCLQNNGNRIVERLLATALPEVVTVEPVSVKG